MDVKEFISSTIAQIVEGTVQAGVAATKHGGGVSPVMATAVQDPGGFLGRDAAGRIVIIVDFDMAVVVAKDQGTEAGAKLEVASFLSLGAGGNSSSATELTNRVRFRIPLALPVDAASKNIADEAKRKREEKVQRGY